MTFQINIFNTRFLKQRFGDVCPQEHGSYIKKERNIQVSNFLLFKKTAGKHFGMQDAPSQFDEK